jgi:hypothetical protein
MSRNTKKNISWVLVILLCLTMIKTTFAERILDVARLQTDVPNELIGMGLVVGLKGTGDGGDYRPAMRQLNKLLTNFGNSGLTEADLKNSNNVAIVHLSMKTRCRRPHQRKLRRRGLRRRRRQKPSRRSTHHRTHVRTPLRYQTRLW